jgi:serine/threonine protein phosphatase 1
LKPIPITYAANLDAGKEIEMNPGQDQLKNGLWNRDADLNDRIPKRLFAIGDIHGCATALKALIQAIGPQPGDTIVVLGDVIDYGPDSRGVIQQLIGLPQRCQLILIRGNHEELLFDAVSSCSDVRHWIDYGGRTTLLSYPDRKADELIYPDHLRFLRNDREFYENEKYIFVHASYDPARPMNCQPRHMLRWESVSPAKAASHCSGKTAIAGHSRQMSGDVLDLGFLKVIDTDASGGGWLTALEVTSNEVIQANQKGHLRRPRTTPG